MVDLPKLHAKLDADTQLDFTIHHRQNKTHSKKKHSCKKRVFTVQFNQRQLQQ
jgi:hypothetical protein